jgi:cyclase
MVYARGGSTRTDVDARTWAAQCADRGAGEILITSIDRDGTRTGYDLDLTREVMAAVPVPVVASGGAGKVEHVVEVLRDGLADAALVAGILHDGTCNVQEIKEAMRNARIPVRWAA